MLIFNDKRIVLSNLCRSRRRAFVKEVPDESGVGRDYQRGRVYMAEKTAAQEVPLFVATAPPKLLDGAIALMAYHLVSDKRFAALFGKVAVDVEFVHKVGRSRAYGDRRVVYCAKGAICGYDIIHEVAHLVTPTKLPPHGVAFASAMLKLVEFAIPEGRDALAKQYKKLKVNFADL